jgi:hypothetical protein
MERPDKVKELEEKWETAARALVKPWPYKFEGE